jgi:hypothetical protein
MNSGQYAKLLRRLGAGRGGQTLPSAVVAFGKSRPAALFQFYLSHYPQSDFACGMALAFPQLERSYTSNGDNCCRTTLFRILRVSNREKK